MSDYKIDLNWKRNTSDFTYEGYDRTHSITFGSGTTIQCTSAPEYLGREDLPNPEELLAAALSSCHMLTFLAIAAKKRLVVDSYTDKAVAKMGKNTNGRLGVVGATLTPVVHFSGATPTPEELAVIHRKSHEACFIANSVNFPVVVTA